jgi:hypothetical protein
MKGRPKGKITSWISLISIDENWNLGISQGTWGLQNFFLDLDCPKKKMENLLKHVILDDTI